MEGYLKIDLRAHERVFAKEVVALQASPEKQLTKFHHVLNSAAVPHIANGSVAALDLPAAPVPTILDCSNKKDQTLEAFDQSSQPAIKVQILGS